MSALFGEVLTLLGYQLPHSLPATTLGVFFNHEYLPITPDTLKRMLMVDITAWSNNSFPPHPQPEVFNCKERVLSIWSVLGSLARNLLGNHTEHARSLVGDPCHRAILVNQIGESCGWSYWRAQEAAMLESLGDDHALTYPGHFYPCILAV